MDERCELRDSNRPIHLDTAFAVQHHSYSASLSKALARFPHVLCISHKLGKSAESGCLASSWLLRGSAGMLWVHYQEKFWMNPSLRALN